jgi:hypothetical protein
MEAGDWCATFQPEVPHSLNAVNTQWYEMLTTRGMFKIIHIVYLETPTASGVLAVSPLLGKLRSIPVLQ